MIPWPAVAALSLAALASCAVDARDVTVRPACVSPAADGLIADFSTARQSHCPESICPGALAGSSVATLGDGEIRGLVFPYDRPDDTVLALAVTGDLELPSDPASSLRVVVSYDSFLRAPPPRVAGIALRFVGCVDGAGGTGLSFRVDGALGDCPLRVALQLTSAPTDSGGAPCPIDQCFASSAVAVSNGITTVPFPGPRGLESNTVAGLQWELDVPVDGAIRCSADFTIDDLRVAPPPSP